MVTKTHKVGLQLKLQLTSQLQKLKSQVSDTTNIIDISMQNFDRVRKKKCTGPWPSPWSGEQRVPISKPKNCHPWRNRGENLAHLSLMNAQLKFYHP